MAVTYADIAKEAGVSKMAVSYAFRNHPRVGKATRERILQIAERMGYHPDPQISRLMAHMRSANKSACREAIGLIWALPEAKTNPFLRAYRNGVEEAANRRGYALDHLDLFSKDMSEKRLNDILEARGIRGLVITGSMAYGQTSMRFELNWNEYTVVVLGGNFEGPAFHRVTADHAQSMRLLLEKLAQRGYERPGLEMTRVVNERTHRLWEGAYRAWYPHYFKGRAPRILQRGTWEEKPFRRWYEASRPDVIISNHFAACEKVGESGLRVPEEVGFAALDVPPNKDISGIDQRYETQGIFAVDMLTAHLNRFESGEPPIRKEMQVEGCFVEGRTLRTER